MKGLLMTEWLAWVAVPEDGEDEPPSRYYVTHGVPFLQLTPFRSAAARYGSEAVALRIAEFAGGPTAGRGVERIAPRPPRPRPNRT